jgi:hypothetical protein
MELLIWVFLSYGITNIIVFGSIFESLRGIIKKINPNFFGVLFSCPMCMSFWVGVFLSLTFISPITLYFNTDDIIINNQYYLTFLDACLSSGIVWIIHNIEEWFEK